MVSSSVVLCEISDQKCVSDKSTPRSITPGTPNASILKERLEYYENKFTNTMKLLKSKDEMLKVHEESLKTAEEHVQNLTEKNNDLQMQLDLKFGELKETKGILDESSDGSVAPPAPPRREFTAAKGSVSAMQRDFDAIKKLYRDCFYENDEEKKHSAKQEERIELLQDALDEMKSRDSRKDDEINRLENMLTSQRWTLNNCQDLIEDVENLKNDVNTTLENINASERFLAAWSGIELTADLIVIRHMLHQLKDDLNTDCMFELQEENQTLRTTIEDLQVQIANLTQQSKTELEKKNNEVQNLNKQLQLDQKLISVQNARIKAIESEQKEIEKENSVLQKARFTLEIRVNDYLKLQQQQRQSIAATQAIIDNLKEKLTESKAQVNSKTAQLEVLQLACQNHESTIATIKEHLDKAEVFVQENVKLRTDVTHLNNQCCYWRAHTLERDLKIKKLEDEALLVRKDYEHLHQLYQDELEEASSRGEEVCSESKHFVWGVKKWMEKMKEKYRFAKIKISELSIENDSLRSRLEYLSRKEEKAATIDKTMSWDRHRQCLRKGFRNVRSENIQVRSIYPSTDCSSPSPDESPQPIKINLQRRPPTQPQSSPPRPPDSSQGHSSSFTNTPGRPNTGEDKHRMSNLILKVKDSIHQNKNSK